MRSSKSHNCTVREYGYGCGYMYNNFQGVVWWQACASNWLETISMLLPTQRTTFALAVFQLNWLAGLIGGEEARILRNAMHASERTGCMLVLTGMKKVSWVMFSFIDVCVVYSAKAIPVPRACHLLPHLSGHLHAFTIGWTSAQQCCALTAQLRFGTQNYGAVMTW